MPSIQTLGTDFCENMPQLYKTCQQKNHQFCHC